MDAAQIAGAGDVPDDDGAASAGGGGGLVAVAVAESVGGLFVTGPEAGEVDHVDKRLFAEGERLIGTGGILGEGIAGEAVGAGA